MNANLRLVLSLAAVLGGLLFETPLYAAAQEGGGRPPTSVRVALAEERVVETRREVQGTLKSLAIAEVGAREPGIVSQVRVQEGTSVAAGEVLVVLDGRRLGLELAEAEARHRAQVSRRGVRSAEHGRAVRELARVEALDERGGANAKDLDDARSEVEIAAALVSEAEAEIASADAVVQTLKQRIDDLTIRAPFAGTVVEVRAEVGEWVPEGGKVSQIVRTDAYEAWFYVPQSLFESVRASKERMELRVAEGSRVTSGEAPRIVPRVDPAGRSFAIFVTMNDPDHRLAGGMSARAWVPTGERAPRLLIPSDALLTGDAGFYVFAGRRMGDGPAMSTPVRVRVLFEHEGLVAVESPDLKAGDPIVVEGNERLFPMMPIQWSEGAP